MRNITLTLTAAATLVFAATAFAGSCNTAMTASHDHDHSHDTIVQVAADAGQFGTLLAAAKAAGLVDALNGDGPLTVFAPTDEAFAKLPDGAVKNLLKPENADQLRAVLTYHVLPGKVMAADVVKLKQAATLQGQSVKVKVYDGKVKIDSAKVVKTDIKASNGVIHVIDSVLLPKNIIQVAESAGQFKTLLAAVRAAGLEKTLSTADLTVFAPTDDAFAKLPKQTVSALLEPANRDKLTAILTYHAAPGRLGAADVVTRTQIKTIQGQSLDVMVKKYEREEGKTETVVKIDGAKVVIADLPALNGVVHVIDAVVMPDDASADASAGQRERLTRVEWYTR